MKVTDDVRAFVWGLAPEQVYVHGTAVTCEGVIASICAAWVPASATASLAFIRNRCLTSCAP